MLLGHQDILTESPKLQFKTIFLVINISCDLSHKHYAPERPVWSIQTLGFHEAITISIIRSRKKKIIPGLLKSVFEIVLKDASNLRIPLSVVCNSDYSN